MSKGLAFTVPGLVPPELNPNFRAHWRTKHRVMDEYAADVWAAASGSGITLTRRPWKQATIRLTQYAVRPRDHDNFLASCKVLIDCLTTKGRRPLGILEDDKAIDVGIELRTVAVKHKADECVLVEIEPR